MTRGGRPTSGFRTRVKRTFENKRYEVWVSKPQVDKRDEGGEGREVRERSAASNQLAAASSAAGAASGSAAGAVAAAAAAAAACPDEPINWVRQETSV